LILALARRLLLLLMGVRAKKGASRVQSALLAL